MSRTAGLCLICVTALFLNAPLTAGEEAPDTLVLCTGERLDGRIEDSDGGTVRFRVGDLAYTFERSGICQVIAGGSPELDPAWVAFVDDIAPRLVHEDKRLAAAARAALTALGQTGRPYLEAAAHATRRDDIRDALLRLARRRGGEVRTGAAAMLDRQVGWARRALDLTPEQEPGFRKALAAFFQDLRDSSDRSASWGRYREALLAVFTSEQMVKFDQAMKEFRNR